MFLPSVTMASRLGLGWCQARTLLPLWSGRRRSETNSTVQERGLGGALWDHVTQTGGRWKHRGSSLHWVLKQNGRGRKRGTYTAGKYAVVREVFQGLGWSPPRWSRLAQKTHPVHWKTGLLTMLLLFLRLPYSFPIENTRATGGRIISILYLYGGKTRDGPKEFEVWFLVAIPRAA